MIFKSIRWRLQIWYGLVFVAVLVGFGATSWQLVRDEQLRKIDSELQRRIGAINGMFRPPPDQQGRGDGPRRGRGGRGGGGYPDGGFQDGGNPDRGQPDRGQPDGPPQGRPFSRPGGEGFRLAPNAAELFGSETNSFYYVIWSPEGNELARSAAAPKDVPAPGPTERGGPPPPAPPRMRGVYREISHFIPGGVDVLVGRSIADDLAGLRWVAWSLAGAGGVVLLLGLAGGWWIATRAIRPIDDISATAVKIASGDLSQRINAGDTDNELGRLAAVLNSTFARLEAAFAQQRQFTSDAAHELRTPLAVMLTQIQTALNRERTPAEYRATVEACQRAVQRMRKLMESLLELARLDAGQEAMKRLDFDLSTIATDCAELVAPLAEARGIKIHCAVPPLPCVGDPERVGQIVTNLLGNAIEYNKEGGEVKITGESQGGTVTLSVSDTGPGIDDEHLEKIFERFYRADQSRSGSHTGLGLAISRAIAEAHGGGIEVSTQVGVGTTFTLRLPAAEPKN